MTAVPDSERRTRYAPVSPTARFNVGFVIFGSSDVTVFIDGVEIAKADATYPWGIDATFDVNGECSTAQVVASGTGWSGLTVDIVGKIAPSRVDQFIDGAGVPGAALNLILNRIVAAERERYDRSTRQLVGQFGETLGPIPAAATRALMALTFDAAGQPTVANLTGDKGWSPVLAVVSDSARRVLQVTDWQGGQGTKPATGLYVGSAGLVALIASGVDVRGATGASGSGSGDMVAANNLSDLTVVATARSNLGLGALAILATVSTAVIDAVAVTTAKIADGAITAVKIAAGAVANSALANMAQGTIKARGTASTGSPEDVPVGVNIVVDATSLRSDKTTINSQAASYTAVLGDAGKLVEISNASANTFTIPPNSSVAFPIGTWINYEQTGAGQTTLTPGAGVTIHARVGLKLGGQYGMATLVKRATDEWSAGGDLSA